MKELIIQALDKAYEILRDKTPTYKDQTITLDIRDISPVELSHILIEEEVPDEAEFDWEEQTVTWTIKEPTSDLNNLNFIKTNFSEYAWKEIKNVLYPREINTNNSGGLNDFIHYAKYRNPLIYELYINKDWDTLVHFYSIIFVNPTLNDFELNKVKPDSLDKRSFRRAEP